MDLSSGWVDRCTASDGEGAFGVGANSCGGCCLSPSRLALHRGHIPSTRSDGDGICFGRVGLCPPRCLGGSRHSDRFRCSVTAISALLVAAPLLFLAPSRRRLAYLGSAVATAIVIAFPLLVTNPSGAEHAIIFGTGNTGGIGGTVLWEFDLHRAPLVLFSRITPIALSSVIAWWTVRRLGRDALEPIPLLAMTATCLGLRLVFEQQLFGYYYMAICVTLILLEVVRGHIRGSVVAWIATVSMVYLLHSDSFDALRPPWLTFAHVVVPLSVICIALVLAVVTVKRDGPNWTLVLWLGMIVAALVEWHDTDLLGIPPTWFWQVIFVPLGIARAAGPLFAEFRRRARSPGVVRAT